MGYTHYWYYNPSKAKTRTGEAFSKALLEIKNYKNLLESRGLRVKGPMGDGDPILNEDVIAYNGDDARGQSHETFGVEREFQAQRDGFSFCKTARKPYDTLVCLSLITLFEAFGDRDVFSYCSDGDDSDWTESYAVYREVNGKEPPLLDQVAPPEPERLT
jgi:hypothetical protein